jgi:ribosomal protein S18 acetylase RimI-like enzyme
MNPSLPVFPITPRLAERAAEALGTALLDDPLADYLSSDPTRTLAIQRLLARAGIDRALANGDHVDGIGDPIAGVALWLRRAPFAASEQERVQAPTAAGLEARALLGPAGLERAEAFGQSMRRLRERARPDRHLYLDSIGVLAEHRRHGLASALLVAEHAWADAEGLPCCLDTLTDANVAFYRGRGYTVVDEEPVPDASFRILAMRRLGPHRSGR